jgi:hypothetical protein
LQAVIFVENEGKKLQLQSLTPKGLWEET